MITIHSKAKADGGCGRLGDAKLSLHLFNPKQAFSLGLARLALASAWWDLEETDAL